MMELNNIYQGDCRKLLKLIDSDSIDLVCSDVAYPVQSRGGSGSMGGYWTESQTRKGKIFKNNDIDISDYINDLYRILKDRSHCYLMCNDYNLMHFLDVVGKSEFHFTKCLIWDKCAKICGRYYMAQKEYIIMLRKGDTIALMYVHIEGFDSDFCIDQGNILALDICDTWYAFSRRGWDKHKNDEV